MTTAAAAAHQRETLRQQMLLRALWRDAPVAVVQGWLRDAPERAQRGVLAYQANAGALAERALLAAYPVLAQLIGEESFAALARTLWRAHAPTRGDMALWGAELIAFVQNDDALAEEPYLADVARVEWTLHQAQSAPDAVAVTGLDLLATHDPAELTIHLTTGAALVKSKHPIVTIWQAHQSTEPDRFAPVRAAFEQGLQETAWVWRQGFVPRVLALAPPDDGFMAALLQGQSIAIALKEAGDSFDFESWLIAALQQGRLKAVVACGAVATSTPA